jgi:type IV pilus assembly protein PilN
MRNIRNTNLFGEPGLQLIETRNINNVQARVFDLAVPLKLESNAADVGGKT